MGMRSVVLDLRNNPGGVLDESAKVAERFLRAGSVIVSQRGRKTIDNRVWRSTNSNPEQLPVVILVDENTASASEIVAGALQDSDRAIIVGKRTFGKGLVQNVIDLPGGAGLTLTAARYFTPSGRSIQRDYSIGGLYDYYNNRGGADASNQPKAAYTITRRKVFGGNGIQPDREAEALNLNPIQQLLLDPIFFYVKQLTAQVVGDRSARVTKIDTVRNGEQLDKFYAFLSRNAEWGITCDMARKEAEFVLDRIDYNIAVSQHGSVEANRLLIRKDPQVRAAVNAIPAAFELAASARRYSSVTRNFK
jgi:carboxyl-terminal processing protease